MSLYRFANGKIEEDWVWTRTGRPERSGSDGAVAKAKGIQYGIALFRLGWDPSQAHNERKR